jgi:predicted dehydrogenase
VAEGEAMSRICLVGAGELSRAHAEALRGIAGHHIAAVVDPDIDAAQRLAQRSDARQVFASVEAALAEAAFDRAHVLVPPELHSAAALPVLAAGKPVLLEQPLAANGEACNALIAAAARSGAALGVNQGFVQHPAFMRLQRLVQDHELGRPVMVFCLRNVPLGELAKRPHDDLLLEYALHPLAQITALAGTIDKVRAFAGPLLELGRGETFPSPLDMALTCEALPARLRLALGRRKPLWQVTAICDDGVAVADILENRIDTHGRTRWRDALQDLSTDLAGAGSELNHAVHNILDAATSLLWPKRSGNPVRIGMRRGIAAFHAALDAGAALPPAMFDPKVAAGLVALCQRVGDQARRDPGPGPIDRVGRMRTAAV